MTCRAFPKLELSLFAKPTLEENPKISPHESIQNNPIDLKLATLVTHGVTSLKRMTRLVIPQKSIHQFQKAFRLSIPNCFLLPHQPKGGRISSWFMISRRSASSSRYKLRLNATAASEPTRLSFAFDSPKHSNH